MNEQGKILEDEEFYVGGLAPSFMPESGYEYIAGVSGWPRPITPGLLGGPGGGPGGPGTPGQAYIPPPYGEVPPTSPEPIAPEPSDPRYIAHTVYPTGSSIFAHMGLLREGPYVYDNPDGETFRGVSTNTFYDRNPFYNLDDSLNRTQYTPRWFSQTGQLLPSSYESYIVPLSEVAGFTEEALQQTDLPQISELGDFASHYGGILDQVGVIPNWYGLDIPDINYSEDRHFITPDDAYIPNDFVYEYQDPGFVEGAYLGPDPGFFGFDESGEPYSGWIPGKTMRGSAGLLGGNEIVWGPEGNAYYIESEADWDKYFPEGMPLGPPSSVVEVSDVEPYDPDTTWVPYNPDDLPVVGGPIYGIVDGGIVDAGPIMDSPNG